MGCKGCTATVRLKPSEVERLLAEYLRTHAEPRAGEAAVAARLALCADCPDLLYGTTCRHCGCLVAVRTALAAQACPAPTPRWAAEPRDDA